VKATRTKARTAYILHPKILGKIKKGEICGNVKEKEDKNKILLIRHFLTPPVLYSLPYGIIFIRVHSS
jgi:hypothetical protein